MASDFEIQDQIENSRMSPDEIHEKESIDDSLNDGTSVIHPPETSIKSRFQGPPFVVPRKFSSYILNEDKRTPETQKEALESRYGRDDLVTLYLRNKSTDPNNQDVHNEHILLVDSRSSIKKLTNDLYKQFTINEKYVKLEFHGGKRLQLQKPDAVLRDIAYKQSNEGSQKFILEMKILPSDEQKLLIEQLEKKEEEERKAKQQQFVQEQMEKSISSSKLSNVADCYQESCRESLSTHYEIIENETNSLHKTDQGSVLMNAINSTEPTTSQSSIFLERHDVANLEPSQSPQTPIEDDEMPSLTMEAPGEEVLFESETPSPRIPSTPSSQESSSSASIPNPTQVSTQKQQKRNVRAPRTNIISYHDLPPGSVNIQQISHPAASFKLEGNASMENKIATVADTLRKPIEEIRKMPKEQIESFFTYIVKVHIEKMGKLSHYTQQQELLRERIMRAQDAVVKNNLSESYRQHQHEINLFRAAPLIPNLFQGPSNQSGVRRSNGPQHHQRRPPTHQQQVHINAEGQRHPVAILPHFNQQQIQQQQQRARVINMASGNDPNLIQRLVKVNLPVVQQIFPPQQQQQQQQQQHRTLDSSVSLKKSATPPQQRVSSGVTFVPSKNGNGDMIQSDPCNFRPFRNSIQANTFVSTASATHPEKEIIWNHYPVKQPESVNVINTVRAVHEYLELCNARQNDPSRFLDLYYMGENPLTFHQRLSIADYNMYASRRRCDNSNVKIPKLSNADQLAIFILNLQVDDPDNEKWTLFYKHMGWELPSNNQFPRSKRVQQIEVSSRGRMEIPIEKKKRKIDDVVNSIAKKQPGAQVHASVNRMIPTQPHPSSLLKTNDNSPTSSEASSISPPMITNTVSTEHLEITSTTDSQQNSVNGNVQ